MAKKRLMLVIVAAAFVLLTLVLALRACGGPPSARELYDQARKNALDARSANITADVQQNGQQQHIEIEGTTDGKNQRFRYVAAGQEITMLSVADKLFTKAPAQFWTGQGLTAAQAKNIANKYVSQPTSSKMSTIKQLLEDSYKDSSFDNMNEEMKRRDVNGIDSYIFTSKAGNSNVELAISADGNANLVQVTEAGKGVMKFSKWNSAETFSEPAAAELASLPTK